jgi:histidinol-phosphate/aromatic aminotransferase/cobyric acid decarboxylase-like protein
LPSPLGPVDSTLVPPVSDPSLVAPPPGPHGGDGHRLAERLGVAVEDVLDLSASLNPFAPDIGAVAGAHLGALARYPDRAAATRSLADAMAVDPDRLLLTNGGAEAIALVAAVRPAGWVEEPDFGLYRRHLAVVDRSAPRWRSDPHNPTGALAAADDRAAVRDEAFYPLTTGRWTRGDAGAIVVGSLTKLWRCPGLRLGYVLAPDASTREELAVRQPQWSVNGLALAVVGDLLAATDLRRWATGLAELRRRLVALLAAHGLAAAPGEAPYVWVPSAPGVRAALATRAVLVRSGASFGSPDAVRVAVCSDADLERLGAALAQARAEEPSSSSNSIR